jgi:hypothetical protein
VRQDGTLTVESENTTVVLTIGASKNRVVTVLLSLWCTGVFSMLVFMVVAFALRGRILWALFPALLPVTMLLYTAQAIRENLKGLTRVTVTPAEIRVHKRYLATRRNGDFVHNGGATFVVWRPDQFRNVSIDHRLWGIGTWSLGVIGARGKKSCLLIRIQESQARLAGEALREAGYVVDGLNDRA